MKKGFLNNQQQGMTLIEIMVALVLGLFLIAGVMQIFFGSKQSYRVLDNLARMQENGRFAMDFISRDIREAGRRTTCFEISVPAAIAGTNDTGVNSSDTVTTQVSNTACPVAGATLPVVSTTFSIANGISGTPGLFKGADEMVEGIENMQILYGEDTDDDFTPNYYVPVSSVVNMDDVVSVRVDLLIVSADNNLSSTPVNYTFNGNVLTPATGDRRLRREFSSTIAVRNRLP